MAVPKQRQNSSRSKRRRAGHKKLTPSKMTACSNCGQMNVLHTACSNCGQYKGREVVQIKTRTKAKAKK